jgi:hypothetical protein
VLGAAAVLFESTTQPVTAGHRPFWRVDLGRVSLAADRAPQVSTNVPAVSFLRVWQTHNVLSVRLTKSSRLAMTTNP